MRWTYLHAKISKLSVTQHALKHIPTALKSNHLQCWRQAGWQHCSIRSASEPYDRSQYHLPCHTFETVCDESAPLRMRQSRFGAAVRQRTDSSAQHPLIFACGVVAPVLMHLDHMQSVSGLTSPACLLPTAPAPTSPRMQSCHSYHACVSGAKTQVPKAALVRCHPDWPPHTHLPQSLHACTTMQQWKPPYYWHRQPHDYWLLRQCSVRPIQLQCEA